MNKLIIALIVTTTACDLNATTTVAQGGDEKKEASAEPAPIQECQGTPPGLALDHQKVEVNRLEVGIVWAYSKQDVYDYLTSIGLKVELGDVDDGIYEPRHEYDVRLVTGGSLPCTVDGKGPYSCNGLNIVSFHTYDEAENFRNNCFSLTK